MTNEQIRKILVHRTDLEDRIRKLGGHIPDRWLWDITGELRNLQLLEIVEDLEREQRGRVGMNPVVRVIRDQINGLDWRSRPEDISAILIEAGFHLRDLADARAVDELNKEETA